MLNWRRDPDRERRMKELAMRKIELDRQLDLLDKQHGHARLDRIRNRLDRGRLAFDLDPSPTHRRELQRLLKLLASPQFRSLLEAA